MPSLEVLMRWQKAVYWSYAGNDEAGQPMVLGPRELDVRWEEIAGEAVDPQGDTIAIDGMVTVDREIPIGSLLWKGKLADLDPESQTLKLMEAKTRHEIPDDKARNIGWEVGVQRFRGSLPQVGTAVSP
jgi:hypothetical protein